MKMMGISWRSTSRFWRSSPLRSGSDTSSTRQFGTKALGRAKKACADAKVSTWKPSCRISASNASRTEMSSSTTNTIGVGCITLMVSIRRSTGAVHTLNLSSCSVALQDHGPPSSHRQRNVECLAQSRIAEGFEQERYRAFLKQPRLHRLVRVSRNEDDRNLVALELQLTLQIGSAHARHRDVKNKNTGVGNFPRREELLR